MLSLLPALALPFTSAVALASAAAALVHTRRGLERERRGCLAREEAVREQMVRLIAAARRSPLAVIEQMESAALRQAPAIEAILFAERHDDAIVIRYAKGMHAGFVQQLRLDPAGRSALARALRDGHRIATGTVGVDRLLGEGAYLAVPLIARGVSLGVVAFLAACAADLGDPDELVRLVELATPAFELAVERRADVDAATIDGLTGLLSPVVFRRRLSEEVLRAQRSGRPCALLFLDTDHFKACNDTLGHAAGDAVLTMIADILVKTAGPDAIVGRNGGDEFCLALPANRSTALRLAERLRAAIEQVDYHALLGQTLPRGITASIGIAVIPDDAQDACALLEAADAAMYHSKRNGRNRVSLYGFLTSTSKAS